MRGLNANMIDDVVDESENQDNAEGHEADRHKAAGAGEDIEEAEEEIVSRLAVI
jgi:hypothetical protein